MVRSIEWNGRRDRAALQLLEKRDIKPFGVVGDLPSARLFGTDGIRGRAGELLNAPLALQLGYWAGRSLRDVSGNGAIVVGQDSRNSSTMLAAALSAGFTAAGVEVWHLGLCPTPCVSTIVRQLGAIGGAMISASHNPPEDNGIKFFGADGTKLSDEVEADIEAGLRGTRSAVPDSTWGQHYYRPELISEYAEALQAPLRSTPLDGLRVVLDLAWGAASELAPKVFRALGAQVETLHDRPDGDRINVSCGSTHLERLQGAVLDRRADIGFAFDGDADRVLAVDNFGRCVDGDYILYLWGSELRDRGQLPDNLLVSTVMANLGFERAWCETGGQFIRTPVGDRHVSAEMRRTGAALGGEQSGHIICDRYGVTGDGLQTALHLAAAIRRRGVSLGELVDGSFRTYPQILKNVRVEDRDRRTNWESCEPLQTEVETAKLKMGDRGRVLVRASGTEPLLRVMVEAETDEMASFWVDRLVSSAHRYLV